MSCANSTTALEYNRTRVLPPNISLSSQHQLICREKVSLPVSFSFHFLCNFSLDVQLTREEHREDDGEEKPRLLRRRHPDDSEAADDEADPLDLSSRSVVAFPPASICHRRRRREGGAEEAEVNTDVRADEDSRACWERYSCVSQEDKCDYVFRN